MLLQDEVLLNSFELTFSAGWTCLLGPSGSGKSSLLRLIAGLDTAARLEGSRQAPERIGWMAQSDLLQPRLTVRCNIELTGRLRGEKQERSRTDMLLSSVQLEGKGGALPATLSGGQRQRVALARVLSEDTPLVLLDEPFSALDPITRVAMQDLAHERLAGRSVIMVTHDPVEALRLSDRILMIVDGSIEEISPMPPPYPRPVKDPSLAVASADMLSRLASKQ